VKSIVDDASLNTGALPIELPAQSLDLFEKLLARSGFVFHLHPR